jgi:allantoinase
MTQLPFTYASAPNHPAVEWPDGARVAVYLELNLESWPPGERGLSLFPVGESLDPSNYGWRDYGARVGIWRLIDVLDRYDVVASAAIDSDASGLYPEIVAAGAQRGWCWLLHGRNGSSLQGLVGGPEAEEQYLGETLAAVAAATGSSPRGWLGPALSETPATISLLARLGFSHVLDWSNDDRPYRLRTEQGAMVAVPRLAELSDITSFVIRGWSADRFAGALIEAFDALYEDGSRSGTVLGIAAHPFLLGQPFRVRALERVLAHARARPDVWWTTSDAIAARTLAGP